MVSLLESEEADQLNLLDEPRAAEANCIRFISFPIPDRGVPVSVPTATSLMAEIANALEEGKDVVVHCRQGIGRSGLIAVGVLAHSGVSLERAIQVVSSARGLPVPETAEQLSWLQQPTLHPRVVV